MWFSPGTVDGTFLALVYPGDSRGHPEAMATWGHHSKGHRSNDPRRGRLSEVR